MIQAGVRYHLRTSAAVAVGVGIATAVIVGALLVGDSMRGSLRELTVERLGKIESVVAPGGFFSAERAPETLGVSPDQLATIVLFDRAVLETAGEQGLRRAGAVQTIGCDQSFWDLDVSGVAPQTLPGDQSIVLTQSLANELGVVVGDQVTVRLPVEQAVPADSPLGRRDVQTEGIPRLEVVDILPDRGLARFSLAPSQATPKNVFLSRQLVADVLDRSGQANVALASTTIDPEAIDVDLSDLGLSLQRITQSFDGETIFDYYQVTSDRLLIDPAAVQAIRDALPAQAVTPSMTYLANAIERINEQGEVTHSVPYSTITAIDSSPELPLDYELNATDEESPDKESPDAAEGGASGAVKTKPVPAGTIPLVLNSWAAEKLEASEGTPLRVAYYEPEVENGKEIERFFDAVVTGIVPLTEPSRRYFRSRPAEFDSPPTRYNDPNLTPSVPGVTDQDSIGDWDLPFELTREISSDDDAYWNNHRLTPKAFLPLADGQRLFGSRFGQVTGLRIDPSVAGDIDQLREKLRQATRPHLDRLGWHVRPIRAMQLAASRGTTPFDGLFLALSFFVIFSAVMLIAMLFRLGLLARSREIGTLMALGLDRSKVARMFLGEGLWIALAGVLLGVGGGIVYAVLVLAALRTYWVGAVTVPFLTFHAGWLSLVGGALVGLLIGMGTLWWTLRSMLRNQTVTLLGGRDESDQTAPSQSEPGTRRGRWIVRIAIVLVIAAVGSGIAGAMSAGQIAAVAFVGGGMMILVATLLLVYNALSRSRGALSRSRGRGKNVSTYSLARLARSNAARSPLRSTLTIGLMAAASFLIVAITAFRLQPTDAGTGGFEWVAECAQPLYEDLSDPAVRSGLLGPDAGLVAGATFVPFRVRAGQDASCNNLYRATEPTILGVPPGSADKLDQFQFFAAGSPETPQPREAQQQPETRRDSGAPPSPWELLNRPAAGTAEDPIPMIVDQNTAAWSLQMFQGIGEQKSFVYDNVPLHFQVVGLLENSLLQGRLIIGEVNFERQFPDISGYRYVLVDTGEDRSPRIASALETRLGDVGFDAADARDVLSGMMAVQNTYLRTFQSLGGLGLLLGTVGLAIAQLRNVLERRSELAVMRAVGFTPRRLASLVMGETASLLLLGIGCGVTCAVIAVLPYAVASGITPPIVEPVLLLLGIVAFGLLAGLVAAGKVIRMPLLESLRGT
ncbi:FtsX-like permease family protein [Roseiconus nitratireducens]|uniref:FtsX-like permease family protein n=2 Tax=Roseiconus nitratireducens TaxID=2605748 RepID=A0A5M6CUM7_9BACT|nr:FtsX-like permease family protein [Roseiconus nitratireducens]